MTVSRGKLAPPSALSSQNSLQQLAAPRRAAAAPPEWVLEKVIRVVGKIPAAVKHVLDRLAGFPLLRPFFALFTSVWLGITLLLLIGLYVGIGSGFASLRARLEMTDLQFFDAWPMQVLVALLAVNLTIVTIRRIPLTIFRLGVWTVHVGIITLLGGCVWYFSQKTEGSVRIFVNQSVGACYDATERALYGYNIDADGAVDTQHEVMARLPKLPIFYEHIARFHNALHQVMPGDFLGRLNPALRDVSLKIVGYYPYAELGVDWVPDPSPEAAANPAIRFNLSSATINFGAQWLVGENPAARVFDDTNLPFSVEYAYHPTAEQIADMTAEFSGLAAITVRIPRLHITRTYVAEAGKPIVVEGSPYTLTPGDQTAMPLRSKGYERAFSNTLLVHVVRQDAGGGAEGGGKEFAFDRMVLARYPERSPDFIKTPEGQQKRVQDRVDDDIQLIFHDASRNQIWIVEHDDGAMELVHRPSGGGKVERLPMAIGSVATVDVRDEPERIALLEKTHSAISVPSIVPPEQRERGQTAMDAMQFSIVEVALARGSFKAHAYVPFVQFAEIGEPPLGREPTVIDVPGVGKIGLLLSTTRRELPVSVKLTDFHAIKYRGAMNSFEDFVSSIQFTDKKSGRVQRATARLNEPAANGGIYYFQSGWGGENVAPGKQFSILGVGNRPGLHVMTLGAILIVIGIGYSFYVKPVLLKAKKESLAAWSARRAADGQGQGGRS